MLFFYDLSDFIFEIKAVEERCVKSSSRRKNFSGFIDDRFDIMSVYSFVLCLNVKGRSFV